MSNLDFNDDEQSDRLDYLADRHADLFFWIEQQMAEDFFLDFEPSPAELALMDANADDLLLDILLGNDYDEEDHGI